MKIEMDSDTSIAVCVTAICAVVVAVSFLIYRYNALAYEKGYTQKQLENSQMVIWVKQ